MITLHIILLIKKIFLINIDNKKIINAGKR